MSILAALCFLIAIILFVIDAFWKPTGPDFKALGLAFLSAGIAAAMGLHL